MKAAILTPRCAEFSSLNQFAKAFYAPHAVSWAADWYEDDAAFRADSAQLGFHYDLVIVAQDGALGMVNVLDLRCRIPQIPLIWISDDPYFAQTALEQKVLYFLTRPISETRLAEALTLLLRLPA